MGIDAFARRLPKAMPAKVTKYDASKQKVDCQVLVQRPYFDEEDRKQVESIPVIPGVPVLFPGSGGFRLTFPISDGNLMIEGSTVPATTGLLVFCDRSIDKWLTGDGKEVDPEIDHDNALADAVFVPGLNPFGAALSSAPTDHATLGADGGSGAQVHLHKDIIAAAKAESNAQFVALSNLVKDELDKISGEIAKIKTTLSSLTGGASAPATFSTPYTGSYTASAVAATVLKAE